jgi:hypothetical protein
MTPTEEGLCGWEGEATLTEPTAISPFKRIFIMLAVII